MVRPWLCSQDASLLRVDKLAVPVDELPHEGEELWIRIPPDKVYLVSR